MLQHIPLKKLFEYQQGHRSDEFQKIENHLADCEHCTENMTLFSPHLRTQETRSAMAHQHKPANGRQPEEKKDHCPPPEQIDGFISNSLPKRQLQEVEKHLAICDVCRRQLIAVLHLSFDPVSEEEKKLLAALPPFEISEQVNAIKALLPKKVGPLDFIRQLPGRMEMAGPVLGIPRPAWALALVLVLGLVGKWWAWPAYQYYRLVSEGETQIVKENRIYYKGELRPSGGYQSSDEIQLMGPKKDEQQTLEARLQQALTYKRDGEKARLRLAQFFLLQKNYSSSDSLLKLLEIASPQNAAVINDRGICFFNRNEFAAAVAAFQRAYELNPRLDEALYNLAITQTQLGNVSTAKTTWEQYLKLDHVKTEWRRAALANLQDLK